MYILWIIIRIQNAWYYWFSDILAHVQFMLYICMYRKYKNIPVAEPNYLPTSCRTQSTSKVSNIMQRSTINICLWPKLPNHWKVEHLFVKESKKKLSLFLWNPTSSSQKSLVIKFFSVVAQSHHTRTQVRKEVCWKKWKIGIFIHLV